jgi:hypothetical protein
VLSTSVTTSAQLSFDSLLIPGATIGKHLRHILDHYRLLLDVVQDPTLPLLSYDRRVRMTLIETSVPDALEAVQTVQDRLKAVRSLPHWLKRKVKLEAVTPEEVQLETTLGREVRPRALQAGPLSPVWRRPDRATRSSPHSCGSFRFMRFIISRASGSLPLEVRDWRATPALSLTCPDPMLMGLRRLPLRSPTHSVNDARARTSDLEMQV